MGQAGVLGVGVGVVVTTGGCCMELKTGTVTCLAEPPRGTACWKAESVTSATGLVPALVTWPLIVAGMVFAGGAASGKSGMAGFDRSVPTGTLKAIVGLYVVVAPRFVTIIADVLHAADQWAVLPATVDDVLDAQRWARERAQRAITTASPAGASDKASGMVLERS